MIPILMLTHNRLAFTKRAIRSVLRHTNGSFTLLVFDNDSTDGTRDYLTEDVGKTIKKSRSDHIRVFFAEENVGVHGGMDFLHAEYPDVEYYAKIDNDTIVPADWLPNLLATLNEYDAELVGSIHYTFSQKALYAMNLAEQKGFAEFGSPGGSGILYRRTYLRAGKVADYAHEMKDGWTNYCHAMRQKGARAGFAGSVFIELLDMKGHFTRKKGGLIECQTRL